MTTVAIVDGSPATPVRGAPLAYAAPTTGRFVILILAVVGAGLFVGSWTHNLLEGDRWVQAVAQCTQSAPTTDPLTAQRSFEDCLAGSERRRAGYALAGGAVTLAAGCLVVALAPVVVGRRRRLRPLPTALAGASARCRELSADAGLARPPRLMIGRASQRDAFSYGVPGRYRIALPPKLAVRPADPVFAPVLRHEMAHVRHRDVMLAWLARSVWYAVLPLTLLPVVLSIAQRDLSVTASYAWRALTVLVIVRLVGDSVLRAREHAADLAAGRGAGPRAELRQVLESSVARGGPADGPVGWRRLRAQHPTPTQRLAVLEDPTTAVRPAMSDGVTAAFLAGTVQPVLQAALITALTASGATALAAVGASLVIGTLLAVSVGLGIWRAAVFYRLAGRELSVGRLAAGVGAGVALGHAMSLGQVAAPSTTFAGVATSLAVPALGGVGAVVVIAGLAEVWTDVAARFRTARGHAGVGLVTSAVVFAVVLWTSGSIVNSVQWLGWGPTIGALLAADATGLLPGVALGLAVAAAAPMLRHAHRPTGPAWAVEEGTPGTWPAPRTPALRDLLGTAAAAGLAGAAAIVLFRVSAGPADGTGEPEARVFAYVLIAAAAGVVTTAVLASSCGVRGAAAGLVAAPIASLLSVGGFLVLNTVLGGPADGAILSLFVGRSLGVVLMVGTMTAAAGALVPARRAARGSPVPPGSGAPPDGTSTEPRRWRPIATLVAAAVVTGTAASFILAARTDLVPAVEDVQAQQSALDEELDKATYLQAVASPVLQGLDAGTAALDAIEATPLTDPVERGRRVREEVLPIIDDLLVTARAYDAPSAEIEAVHASGVEALALLSEGLDRYAFAVERQDLGALDEARELLDRGSSLRVEWSIAILQMNTDLTRPSG